MHLSIEAYSPGYPLIRDLNHPEMTDVFDHVCSHLDTVQSRFDYEGFNLVFRGTSGAIAAQGVMGAFQRMSDATRPSNVQMAQVAKMNDTSHHRMPVESTVPFDQLEGFAHVFLDDFISSGDTLKKTRKVFGNEWDNSGLDFRFDGVILITGSSLGDMNMSYSDFDFVIDNPPH